MATGNPDALVAFPNQRSDFLTKRISGGAAVKARPSDFIVEEIPLYDPIGSGEHLYLRVEKTNLSHEAMVTELMRHFDVPRQAIGTAGRKDKLAITRQWVSVHLHQDPSELDIGHDRLKVLDVNRHANKLRIGHLKGNRFQIRLRHISPTSLPAIQDRLVSLIADGVPNYFDTQRFGVRGINHLLGRALIVRDPLELVRLLTESGDADQWPDRSPERLAVSWTQQGQDAQRIASRLGRQTRQFWMSALQSAVFNRVLDQRIEQHALKILYEGDLAWKHDSGSVFAVTSEVLTECDTVRRLADFEISPSGPMWGSRMTRCGDPIDRAEVEALQHFSLEPEQLSKLGRAVSGARRPLRVNLGQAVADQSHDEHGSYIELSFALPPGSYATIVLREIIAAAEKTSEEDLHTDRP